MKSFSKRRSRYDTTFDQVAIAVTIPQEKIACEIRFAQVKLVNKVCQSANTVYCKHNIYSLL